MIDLLGHRELLTIEREKLQKNLKDTNQSKQDLVSGGQLEKRAEETKYSML